MPLVQHGGNKATIKNYKKVYGISLLTFDFRAAVLATRNIFTRHIQMFYTNSSFCFPPQAERCQYRADSNNCVLLLQSVNSYQLSFVRRIVGSISHHQRLPPIGGGLKPKLEMKLITDSC